ncbi:MAG: hydroxyacid dehydrogenase [Candidatus ainarchaeum sp.]|nr:hydroxyacid dehydrogenase [Candidatus ainarchaeum sp.]
MKVLISDKINENAINLIKEAGITVDYKINLSEDEIVNIIPEYDALLVRSDTKVTNKILDAGVKGKLKLVGRAGVGTDNIDKEKARELGIVVENTPLGNTNAAAEHTLTMLLMLSKHIIHANDSMKKGEWDRSFKSSELKEKTLGLIGFGNVGRKVARVAKALEMNVLVYDPFVHEAKLNELNLTKVELKKLICESDYISVHVPLTKQTKNMINTKEFNEMKTGVRILNVARGGVINETALLNAINSGKVSAAALDVYENEPPTNTPLVKNEHVIATPHLGASTNEAQVNVAIEIAEQVVLALNNNEIKNCVNGLKKFR